MSARAAALTRAMSLGIFFLACRSEQSPTPHTGGAYARGASAGGAPNGGSPGMTCGASPCGGTAVGTWNVASSCLAVSGTLDLSLVGAQGCLAPITGSLTVNGTFTANADGTYSD